MAQAARSWLTINGAALRGNWSAFQGVVGPGVGVLPVLKANAYGHGLAEVCQALQPLGEQLPGLVVDQIAEAVIVRQYFPEHSIICLGWTPPEELEVALELRVIQNIVSESDLVHFLKVATSIGQPGLINLELETGLNRLGASSKELIKIMAVLKGAPQQLEVKGLSSHFAEAEQFPVTNFTAQQNTVFYDASLQLGLQPTFSHIGCTASTLTNPAADHTHVRLGLGLYGLWPGEGVKREGTLGKRHVDLTPALEWHTHIAQVKEVEVGGTVGYNRTFTANRVIRIAVLPVGYADGLDRRLTGQAVLIKGARCPIVGRICMNMCMVDVSAAPQSIAVGDRATLIGREGLSAVTIDDWAQAMGTINYEVVARLSALSPRILV